MKKGRQGDETGQLSEAGLQECGFHGKSCGLCRWGGSYCRSEADG